MNHTFVVIFFRIVVCVLSLLISTTSPAASFPCEKAATLQEELICSNPDLSQLDEKLAVIYRSVIVQKGNNDKLRRQQKEWLANDRDRCTDVPCLSRAYTERIIALNTVAPLEMRPHSEIAISTYLGGKGDDRTNGIRVDHSGNIYIGGYTQYWDNFPTLNAIQDTRQGDYSGIVAKFSSDGRLLWATHLGGSESYHSGGLAHNVVTGIALANDGGLYAAGDTSAVNFPTLNAVQATAKGVGESFLTKFDGNGKLVWSTYIGGYGPRIIRAVTSDTNGFIYLVGQNGLKCVIAKFNNTGQLLWSKEFGGTTHRTEANAISLDKTGNIYIGGTTGIGDLPRFVGDVRNAKGRWLNPYIAKFNNNGDLLWSTKIGGSDDDYLLGLVTDPSGSVYVTGNTKSKQFPTLNANQPTQPGREDIFVAKFSPEGHMLWSTYLGGAGTDGSKSIVVDVFGNIHVTGHTASIKFPIKNAFQERRAGLVNAFVTTFNPDGRLVRSSYLGGNGFDIGFATTADINSNVYITGYAGSSDFPLKNPYQDTHGGLNDIFVTKIGAIK